jgi:hypothetical protein
MATITESFANLSTFLLAEFQRESTFATARPHARARQLLVDRFLRPLLPTSVRVGPGTLIDVRDRGVGPFDVIACSDAFPPFGDGLETRFLVDGAIFACNMRDWAAEPISDFAKWAMQVKNLERAQTQPLLCAALSYTPVSLEELKDFMQGPEGKAVDAVFCMGHHLIARNDRGLFGDPAKIPFVTQRESAQAFKAFAFLLLQATQAYLGNPFDLGRYQHL